MIGLFFKRTTRILSAEISVSKVVIGVALVETRSRRSFGSKIVPPATMNSTQQLPNQKRAVGKKFVVACDGESLFQILVSKDSY